MDFLERWQKNVSENGKLARRAWPEIFYTQKGSSEKTDITEDISKYFVSLTYTDNLSGTADDLSLVLEDKDRLWIGDWMPTAGDFLSAIFHIYAWENLDDGEKVLDIGKFEIDGFSGEEIPTTVDIKAISILGDGTTLRETKKSKSWDKINLKKIASDIAVSNKLELFFDVDDDPEIDHVEQSDESDLEFLEKITKDAGNALKVTTDKIIIFDEYKYEREEPKFKIIYPGDKTTETELTIIDKIENFHYDIKTRDIYTACRVRHQQGKGKAVIEGVFTVPNANGQNKILEVKESVKNEAEAVRLAKKKLREKNKDAVKIGLTIPGNLEAVAGVTTLIEGFGKLDGKYIITKAGHSISNGYTTSLDLRRCLDGY